MAVELDDFMLPSQNTSTYAPTSAGVEVGELKVYNGLNEYFDRIQALNTTRDIKNKLTLMLVDMNDALFAQEDGRTEEAARQHKKMLESFKEVMAQDETLKGTSAAAKAVGAADVSQDVSKMFVSLTSDAMKNDAPWGKTLSAVAKGYGQSQKPAAETRAPYAFPDNVPTEPVYNTVARTAEVPKEVYPGLEPYFQQVKELKTTQAVRGQLNSMLLEMNDSLHAFEAGDKAGALKHHQQMLDMSKFVLLQKDTLAGTSHAARSEFGGNVTQEVQKMFISLTSDAINNDKPWGKTLAGVAKEYGAQQEAIKNMKLMPLNAYDDPDYYGSTKKPESMFLSSNLGGGNQAPVFESEAKSKPPVKTSWAKDDYRKIGDVLEHITTSNSPARKDALVALSSLRSMNELEAKWKKSDKQPNAEDNKAYHESRDRFEKSIRDAIKNETQSDAMAMNLKRFSAPAIKQAQQFEKDTAPPSALRRAFNKVAFWRKDENVVQAQVQPDSQPVPMPTLDTTEGGVSPPTPPPQTVTVDTEVQTGGTNNTNTTPPPKVEAPIEGTTPVKTEVDVASRGEVHEGGGNTSQKIGRGMGAANIGLQLAEGNVGGATQSAVTQAALEPETYEMAAKVAPAIAKAGLKEVAKHMPLIGGVVTAGTVLYSTGEKIADGQYGAAASEFTVGAGETVVNFTGLGMFGVGEVVREGGRAAIVATAGEEYAPDKSGVRMLAEGVYEVGKGAYQEGSKFVQVKTEKDPARIAELQEKLLAEDAALPKTVQLNGKEEPLAVALRDQEFNMNFVNNLESAKTSGKADTSAQIELVRTFTELENRRTQALTEQPQPQAQEAVLKSTPATPNTMKI